MRKHFGSEPGLAIPAEVVPIVGAAVPAAPVALGGVTLARWLELPQATTTPAGRLEAHL